ncbi:tricarballylate dehydrogenase [Colletotrichum musicola]|uniref:Tricarballylate dehydrogenase n=1 Tax=Colletotrichum musicola TaxID=2175873 RepID=A0A8H6NEQ3_9PEZI|nr:tricarballylate dehydrogenase [Colletotrichum musicola]
MTQSPRCHVRLHFCHISTVRSDQPPDIIVVGAGIAGVCTSIAAAENWSKVLLLDDAHGGGASALSGGVVYAGGGTKQQKEAGYGHDTPDNMFAYLKAETGDAVDETTLKRFCDESVERLEWMEKHGARFEASLCPYKTSYPTSRHYLYFSGNEKAHPFNKLARSAPRGHRMVQPGFSGGELWHVLLESAICLGVQFRPATKLQKVLFDEDGRTSGVLVKSLLEDDPNLAKHKSLVGKTKKFQLMASKLADVYQRRAHAIWHERSVSERLSSKAVVLSAGGFAFNPDMRREHLPEFSSVAPLGTRGDDGSGINIGLVAGGSVSKMNNMSAWRFLYPPTALLEGVVVSQGGDRFAAEDMYGATLSDIMIRQHQSRAFLILDSVQWAKAKSQLLKQTDFPVVVQRAHWLYWDHKKADSIESLAGKFGIAAERLNATLEAYNGAIERHEEDPMRKAAEYCTPLLKAPFYGINISARLEGIQAVNGLTLGGLRVDGETGLVLTEKNEKIRGLYAAGRTAVGVCANGYVSGLSIADCVFSGKRAGEHAALQASREKLAKTY